MIQMKKYNSAGRSNELASSINDAVAQKQKQKKKEITNNKLIYGGEKRL
jgi:hypothetical protein